MSCSDYIRPTTFRTGIEYNGRYTKLGWKVGKINFYIRNLIWRSMTNLCLLRSCADLLSNRFCQKEIVGKSLVEFFGVASNQPNILTLYV